MPKSLGSAAKPNLPSLSGKTGMPVKAQHGPVGAFKPGVPGGRPAASLNPTRGQLGTFLGVRTNSAAGQALRSHALDGAAVSQIRDGWQNLSTEKRPFAGDWASLHAAASTQLPAWHYWNNAAWAHPGAPYYWWRGATAAAVTSWVAVTWAQPTYYNYGENVVYQDDTVYIDDQPYSTTAEYYNQATDIAASATALATTAASDVEWLPLGVFSVVQGDAASSDSLLQLAVSKQGTISGSFFHRLSGTTRPLQGAVDKTTQRAVWTFADDESSDVVMEAGIMNLTEEQCNVLIHYGPKQTEVRHLVRLAAPDASAP